MSDNPTAGSAGQPRNANRRVLHVTCRTHGGAASFTNLVATKIDGAIEFDPHVTGACVLLLDEVAATVLFDALGEWLG